MPVCAYRPGSPVAIPCSRCGGWVPYLRPPKGRGLSSRLREVSPVVPGLRPFAGREKRASIEMRRRGKFGADPDQCELPPLAAKLTLETD